MPGEPRGAGELRESGERVVVCRVEGDEAAALAYLRERGLIPGDQISWRSRRRGL